MLPALSCRRKTYMHAPFIMLCELEMTCYFRHLKDFFDKAGIAVTPENKRDVDKVIHEIVGVKYKNCSATWRQVKLRIAEDEAGFIVDLNKMLNNQK